MHDEPRSGLYAAVPSGHPIEPEMNPNDEAPPGSPETAETVCPKCTGSGLRDDGKPCDNCNGTGKVIEGPGGV